MNRNRQPYQAPPPVFEPGEVVYHVDTPKVLLTIRDSDHCYAWVEGRRYGIAVWLLRRKEETKQQYLKRAFSGTQDLKNPA